jgi:hypothetical protein
MRKIIIIALVLFLLLIAAIRLFSGEDTWVCSEGQWVKHGHPSEPQPSTSCADQILKFKVFFGSSNIDPGALECGTTYGVSRQADFSGSKYGIALKSLLDGPSALEKEQGYFSSLNPETQMPKIEMADGVVTLNFGPDLDQGIGGSCMVSAIRSQIVNTIKQFPEVKEVVIAIDGNSEEALQP